MKNWQKTSLYTSLILLVVLLLLIYFLPINISLSSSDLEFSPGEPLEMMVPDTIEEQPKNIIFFVADGMGFSHLSLALMTQQEEGVKPVWDEFEVRGWHDARCTYGPLTDSGASATALATGVSTFWEVIGQDTSGQHLESVIEMAQNNGYASGIVTDSYVWDATPAAFVAHTSSRDNAEDILNQIASSKLDLIFGELEDVGEDGNPDLETTLEIIDRRYHRLDEQLDISEVPDPGKPIAAIFKEDQVNDLNSTPTFPKMVEVGLNRLILQEKPFILIVECEEMDAASHANNSGRVIKGLKAMQEALAVILEYAKKDGETLVVFTSDHETGGLSANGNYGSYPDMFISWTTREHTATVVPVLATGPGAEHFSQVRRNRDIGLLLKKMINN